MTDIPSLKGLKILIVHFRVGKTDGVSIEIAAWKEILESAGAIVKLCSGPINTGADYVISNLEQQLDPTLYHLDNTAFTSDQSIAEDSFITEVKDQQDIIKKEFSQVLEDFHPDRIIMCNIFAVGEHIAAAGAFANVLDVWKVPTLAVNYDFWWENIRYKKPAFPFVEKELNDFFPPVRPWLRHAVINSIAQKAIKERKGVDAQITHDTVDFTHYPDNFRHPNLLGEHCNRQDSDILILQATRIVRRKNIEIAIDLVNALSSPPFQSQLAGKPLYNGRTFDPSTNKIVLVLAGYAEKRDEEYKNKLFDYAKKLDVHICYLGDIISKNDPYTLWDAYPQADLVTFPSEYEGFGNQFLEAVYAKKPIALFEYPVFKVDIAPKDFSFISLGDQLSQTNDGLKHVPAEVMDQACQKIVDLLTDSARYQEIVGENFNIGQQNFSFEITRDILIELLA